MAICISGVFGARLAKSMALLVAIYIEQWTDGLDRDNLYEDTVSVVASAATGSHRGNLEFTRQFLYFATLKIRRT
jgi:hypothetical protein